MREKNERIERDERDEREREREMREMIERNERKRDEKNYLLQDWMVPVKNFPSDLVTSEPSSHSQHLCLKKEIVRENQREKTCA